MTNLQEAQELLVSLSPKEKLEVLIEFSKTLPTFPEEKKIEENKVPGCVSTAYLTVEIKKKRVYFQGYSDALTIKGFMALLINEFNGMKKEQFLQSAQSKVQQFITKTKLQASLVPSRANTIGNILQLMIRRVQNARN
tara:strand:+ start:758 stop:1171 length:414 start_codon:yes stop_codon:yes gene_type:complete